ncbi:hypothetical protein Bca52824_066344 [Brassica carinata]|uniref:Uncharacterized protein n=1 Tax=Brassica carinata TaxID=52824 RepID=A0A8X7QJY7_BRACI|nr:hypothetical protein Bca52824_066344 [Brassica carinata]
MSNSEKLDKLIQMVRDLDKRVVVIQNVLGVKFNDSSPNGSPNKEDCENGASSGDRRSAQDYENEEDTIDEESNSDDKKSAPDDENEEDTIAEEANSWDGRSALDDENEEETCDKKVKSCTEHLREEENILGENETTQKITQDEDTEKLESESCLKQTSQVSSPIPTFTSPKFDLLSRESHSGKGTNEVLMRDVCEIPVFQPLMKIKKRLVQQDSPHIEVGFELLKLRQINNPDLFLNKTALVIGVKFLEEIDELYDEFLDDNKGFQFVTGFDKYNIEKNINFLYSAIAVAEKYLLGVVVNLENRSITAFNCAAMKFTDASLVPYVNAYAMALPFMIHNFFKDVNMDTSKFSIIYSVTFLIVSSKLKDGEVNEDASKKPVKEDDAEVDVGAKEIENPETNEDGEVSEDASKKPVKGTKKLGRGTKGMKKCVTPPREVQQQVKDDAEVDAKESENPKTNELKDGEVNEDASKKHVKFTKKRGRVTKEPNVDTSKSKRQKNKKIQLLM